jgi:hypothetical protein
LEEGNNILKENQLKFENKIKKIHLKHLKNFQDLIYDVNHAISVLGDAFKI